MKGTIKRAIRFSFIIVIMLALSLILFSAQGVLADTHASTVTVDPSIVAGGEDDLDFDVEVCNNASSPDSIHEFRIYYEYEDFTEFTDVECQEETGWYLSDEFETIWGKACVYSSLSSANNIDPDDCEYFEFTADTPTEECCRTLRFETRDDKEPQGDWNQIDTDICVDSTPPETIKSFDGPQKIEPIPDTPYAVEWIDGETYVVLNATDSIGSHDSGIAETLYKNVLSTGQFCEPNHPCLDLEKCKDSLNHKDANKDTGEWILYDDTPFQKEDESCHVLFYYSVDGVGNEEDVKVNCFFVDKTAPIGEKEVGDPKIPQDLEEEGDGYARWSVEKVYSQTHSAKLYVSDGTQDWAGVDIEVDMPIEDITELSFWEYIESYAPNGWSVNVMLGIDADGDGDFEADVAAWHIGPLQHNPSALGDDTFIEMDGKNGNPATGDWTQTDALSVAQWWTPNAAGDGFGGTGSGCYSTLSNIQNQVAPCDDNVRFEPTDHVKLIKLLIGGSGSWMNETAFVDDLSLNNQIIMSEPPTYYITQDTEITLSCEDQEPHPSGDEEVCYKVSYDLSPYDLTDQYCDEPLEHIIQPGYEEDWCCVPTPKTIIFEENSEHDLEYFCRDAVNKKSPIDLEWFKVDSQPPIIEKEMIGEDHLGECPPENPGDECYVRDDGLNGVAISVEDDVNCGCAVNDVTCTYELLWNNPTGSLETVESGEFGEEGKDIIFTEDSTHTLKIWCEDALGNEVYDEEVFLVDSEPPVTEKVYGDPTKVVEGYRWITTATDITLDAVDAKIGVEGIYYLNEWVSDEKCEAHPTVQVSSNPMSFSSTGWGGWSCPAGTRVVDGGYEPEPADNPVAHSLAWKPGACVGAVCWPQTPFGYTYGAEETGWIVQNGGVGQSLSVYAICAPPLVDTAADFEYVADNTVTFNIPGDSCHVIQYYSVDLLGNTEEVQEQFVMVDNTPPISDKQHGTPYISDDTFGWVTQDTTLSISCADQDPHPVGQEILYWRFSKYTDGFGGTPIYSQWYNESYGNFPVEVSFPDDCWHDIEYYCVDHLGNEEQHHTQYYIVDTKPPVIEKEIVGPKSGDCPPKGEDICYIDGTTMIEVDVIDPEPHPVNEVTCDWEYELLGHTYGPYNEGSSFTINFPEESTHILTITCRDKLGNEVVDEETFLVDKTPPGIWKRYGQPYYINGAEWISSETPIYAGVTDDGPHKSGIKEVEYRTTRVDDGYCNGTLICEDATGDGTWTSVDPGDFNEFIFNIEEDSCHLIEIYAEDNVDKSSTHKQCIFVDNQPPTPIKEVGQPKTKWDGLDSDFYPEETAHCWDETGEEIECWKVTLDTTISMTCEDPQPHPVDNERICFNVELDGEDWTESYCDGDAYDGDYNESGDGYCCLDYTIGDFTFLESCEHNLKFYCEDALGNSNKEDFDEEKFKVEGNNFTIKINKKWNLISVPVVLLNPDIKEVIPDSMGDVIVSVWAYDPSLELCGDEWCVYTPDGNDMNDDLYGLVPGWGYWVLSLDETEIVIGGSLLSPRRRPPSRDLVEGWNLAGYYGLDDQTGYYGPVGNGQDVKCALGTLCGPLWFEEWSSVVTYWQPYSNPWVYLGRSDNMDPGAGYWLFMRDKGEYSVATSCCSLLGT